MDRGVLGLPAARSRRRPHRLPLVPGLSASRQPDCVRQARAGRSGRAAAARGFRCARGARVAASRDGVAGGRACRAPARHGRAGRCRRDHLHLGGDRGAERRRHHPPERPRQHRARRAGGAEIPQVEPAVFSDPVPQPPAAQPHVRPGHGDVRAADAVGRRGLHAGIQPRGYRDAGQDASDFRHRLRAENPRRPARARAARRAGSREPEPARGTGSGAGGTSGASTGSSG